jgi:glycosyltransferase involved in cell wall biosynthesis
MRFHALLLTLDEELQVRGCLDSLAAAESVLVIDSGSRDRTLAIVAEFPRARVVARPFVSFADQRNFGLARGFAAGEWVFHVDADERLTPALVDELRALAPPPEVVACNVAALTHVGGRPVPRASGFPVYQTRLTRAGAFAFEQVGHGQKAPARYGALPRLRAPYEHHPFEKGFAAWRARHATYARQEARDLAAPAARPALAAAWRDPIARRQWLKHASARLPLRPTLVWAWLMFVRRGLLDGRPGWEYCRLRRLYESMLRSELRRLAR